MVPPLWVFFLACPRRSDSGEKLKVLSPFFCLLSPVRVFPNYLNAWNRLPFFLLLRVPLPPPPRPLPVHWLLQQNSSITGISLKREFRICQSHFCSRGSTSLSLSSSLFQAFTQWEKRKVSPRFLFAFLSSRLSQLPERLEQANFFLAFTRTSPPPPPNSPPTSSSPLASPTTFQHFRC